MSGYRAVQSGGTENLAKCLFGLPLLAALLLLTSLPSQSHNDIIDTEVPNCDFGTVLFDLDFAGARINHCRQTGRREFSLATSPENQPINHSPWYAFRVYSAKRQTIQVYLNYKTHKHRYHPKLSLDGQTWEPIDERDIQVLFNKKTVRLSLDVGPEGLWVSGQEIIDNEHYENWTAELAKKPFLERSVLGQSREGRDIIQIDTKPKQQSHYIVLVGRQHPPEVTGAIGMEWFAERLFKDEPLANQFREIYGIYMVPNMNPDGVHRGHWRHATGGIDLNRDWGPFTQPETRLVGEALDRFKDPDGPKLDVFLDFHSTAKDVFYTQPKALRKYLPDFTADWLASVEKRVVARYPEYELREQPGHNPDLDVSKKYMNDTFGIPAITFEYGDHTDRQRIKDTSEIAAEEMMKLLLSYRQ